MERAAAEAAAADERVAYDPATGKACAVHTSSTTNSTDKATTAHKVSKAYAQPRACARGRNTDEVDYITDEARSRATQADAAADAMVRITSALNEVSTSTSAEAQGRHQRKKTQTPAGEAMAARNTVKALKASKIADGKAKRLAQAQGGETAAAKKTRKVSAQKPKLKRAKKSV